MRKRNEGREEEGKRRGEEERKKERKERRRGRRGMREKGEGRREDEEGKEGESCRQYKSVLTPAPSVVSWYAETCSVSPS